MAQILSYMTRYHVLFIFFSNFRNDITTSNSEMCLTFIKSWKKERERKYFICKNGIYTLLLTGKAPKTQAVTWISNAASWLHDNIKKTLYDKLKCEKATLSAIKLAFSFLSKK